MSVHSHCSASIPVTCSRNFVLSDHCRSKEYAQTAPDFLVALLEALPEIGDAGALPAVQNLATGLVTTPNSRRVQVAARKCLPTLRLRIQTRETSNTLLRASSLEDAAGASLLRPAQGGNTDLAGEIVWSAVENFLDLTAVMDKLGHIHWSVTFTQYYSTPATLRLEFDSDQSYLPALIDQLDAILTSVVIAG